MTNDQVQHEERKGTHPLVWVAVGCAGVLMIGSVLLLLGGIFIFNRAKDVMEDMGDNPVVTTARLIAAANPEIELVEADEEDRIVTFRNTKTGEEYTFDFEEIEEGKIRFYSDDPSTSIELEAGEGEEGSLKITTNEGTATFGAGAGALDLPSWLPVYPGTTPKGTYSGEIPEERAGAYTIETDEELEDVIDFYVSELERKGFEIIHRTTTSEGAFLTAQTPNEKLTVNVAASVDGREVRAVINFMEK